MCNLLIEKRGYNVIGILENEVQAITSFESNFSGELFIRDVIEQISKNNVPISYYDVWLNAKNIVEYIEEAMECKLIDPNADSFNLVEMFRSGYFLYYQNTLTENLDALVFNIMRVKVNEVLNTYTEEELENLAINEIESEMLTVTEKYDCDKKLSDIELETEKIVNKINNGEFSPIKCYNMYENTAS